MRDLLRHLLAAIRAGRSVVWCRLVETRGSTPQKAGAAMVVYKDVSKAGTLGGGCVEAEVKRRALGLLAENRAEVCTFQLDSDYGWDDGLICGGRMKIAVEPIGKGANLEYFDKLSDIIERGEGCTEAILFDGEATGLTCPKSVLFDSKNELIASLPPGDTSAGELSDMVVRSIRPLRERPRAYAAHGVAYLP